GHPRQFAGGESIPVAGVQSGGVRSTGTVPIWQFGAELAVWSGLQELGSGGDEGLPDLGTAQPAVPGGVLQCAESSELLESEQQYQQSDACADNHRHVEFFA